MGRKVVLRSILVVGLAVAGLATLMGLLTSGQEQVHASPAQVISGEASTSMAELTDYAAPPPPEARPDSLGFPLGPMAVRSPSGPLAPMGNGNMYCVHPLSGTHASCTKFFTNVQAAVDAATGGETIKVAQGTYTNTGNQVVAVAGSFTLPLTLEGGYTTTAGHSSYFTGTSNPDVYVTTLDGEGSRRAVYISGSLTITVEGFRIYNGDAAGLGGHSPGDDAGGGVYAITATVTISNNRIVSNTAQSGAGAFLRSITGTLTNNNVFSGNLATNHGGGAYLAHSNYATLSGNTFRNNTANDWAGGIQIWQSDNPVLSGNIFRSNTAETNGGGVSIHTGSGNAKLDNNIIADNTATTGSGSGVYVNAGDTVYLRHNTIAHNASGDGVGVYVNSGTAAMTNTIIVSHTVGISLASGNATLTHTLWGTGAWGNVTDTLGNVITGTASDGNFWGNPDFVDPNAGNYHIGVGSAAIDEGVDASVTVDIDGDSRPSSFPDIGADETTAFTVTKEDNYDPVQTGEQLTYTIQVTNTGAFFAATITDTLPTCVTPTGLITWTPTVTASGWTTTVVVTVDDPCTSTLTNIVTVTGQGVTYTDTETTDVAGVTVTKQADPVPMQPGGLLTYTIYVTNTGSVSLTATITDTLTGCTCTHTIAPTPISSITSTEGLTITWSPITITAPSGVWTATVVVTAPTGCQALTNTVEVATVEGVAASKVLLSQAQSTPVLSLTKQDEPDPVLPGELLTYTLCVSNTGGEASDLLVSDTVPASTTYQTCSGGSGCGESSGVVTWTLTSLSAKTECFTFTVQVTDSASMLGQSIANQTYAVTCTEGVSATGDVVTTSVDATRAVTLTTATDTRSGDPDGMVTYTLRVTNTGEYTDTFDIEGTGAWTPTLSFTDTGELAADGYRDIVVTVTIPTDAQCGVYTAKITATSQGDGSKSASSVLTTTVNTVPNVEITPPEDSQSDYPGETVTYTLSVTNSGNCDDAFTITKSIVDGAMWTPDISITDTQILTPDGITNVVVTVPISSSAKPGDWSVVVVTATSQTSTAFDSSRLTTTVAPPDSDWDKLVYVKPTNPITDFTDPITVTTGEIITIVDRVLITYTNPVTFTLVETWTDSLDLYPAGVSTSKGGFTYTTNVLTWTAQSVATETWHAITKTFEVTDTGSIFDDMNETLMVEGAAPQPIAVTFRNTGVCWPVSIDDLISDSPVEVGEAMHFTATVSGDEPITYTWDFGGTGTQVGTDDNPSYTYDAAGTYTVTLNVTNTCVSTDTDFITVTVNPRPVSDWEKDVYLNGTFTDTRPITVTAGDTISVVDRVWVTYTAPITFTLVETWTDSLDLTGWVSDTGSVFTTASSLTWEATGVETGTWHALTKTFVVTGGTWTYDLITETLNVEDGDPVEPQILEFKHGCEPVTEVNFEWSPLDPEPGETVTFTAEYTPSYATPPIAYSWDISGTSLSGNPVYHTFLVSDTYPVIVTVTNPCGGPVTMTHDVVVSGTAFTPNYSLTMEPPTRTLSGDPSGDVIYTLWLTNTGNVADTFTVTKGGNGWTTDVMPEQVNLPPSGTQKISVTVTVTDTASCTDFDTVNITATSQAIPTVSASSVLTTEANTVCDAAVSALDSTKSAVPGNLVTYTLNVTNTGNCTDTFDVGKSGDVWTTTLSTDVLTLAQDVGDSLVVTVTVPVITDCSAIDSATIIVTSTTQSTASDSVVLDTSIVPEYGVTIYAPDDAKSGAPTEPVLYTLQVTNTSRCNDTFTMTRLMPGWATSFNPESFSLDANGGTRTLTATVTVTDTASPGDMDTATIQVEGTGVTDTAALTTTVTQPETKWEKQLYVNGTLTATTPITEVNVRAGDAISIVDQVWVTYTVPTTFTLVEEWTESLTLTQATSDTGGTIEDTGTLTWTGYVTGHHALTKTFDLTDTRSIDYVTETLTVEGADQITQPVVTLRQGCLPVQITNLDSNSPVEVGETMYFTAATSGDTPITYTWDFGEGSPQTGVGQKMISYTYATAGEYTVTLNVTNTCPTTDTDFTVVTVNPKPGVVWDKDVTVEGMPFAITDTIPVVPGDLVQIVDRVWITYTGTVTYTLVETWTTSLSLTDVSTDSSGSVVSDTGVLTWSVAGAAPNAYHTFTKTLTVNNGGDLFDYVTEVLTAEQVLTDTLSKPLTFRNANVVVTPTTVSVAEGGANDTYDVVLTSAPTDTVTVTLSYDAAQVTVSSDTLAFDSGNWSTAQVVTVTAVDDALDEVTPHNSTITHSTQSACPSYDGLGVADLTAVITDDDTAGVNVAPTTVNVDEAGPTSEAYDVVLESMPTDVVTVNVTFDGQVTATPIELVFNPGPWSVAQVVTVTAVDDVLDEAATHNGLVTNTFTSSDADYNGEVVTVTAVITDNDHTLTVNVDGSGTVTPTAGAHVYPQGTMVWLTATADSGSTFAGWDGAVIDANSTVSVTMDSDKVVTATFNAGGVELYQPTEWVTSPYAIAVHHIPITNTGGATATFNITYGNYSWVMGHATNPDVELSAKVITLGQFSNVTATLVVTVHIPSTVGHNVIDTLTITATEQSGSVQDTSVLTTYTGCRCNFDYAVSSDVTGVDALQVVNAIGTPEPKYNFTYPVDLDVTGTDVMQAVNRIGGCP